MRIAIIGAGVAGVCSAYELALQGHEIQVFERDTSVGTGASFGSAGLLAPGLLQAQAIGMPAWRDAPRHLGWRWACWRQQRAQRGQAVPAALSQLAQRSQALLSVWRRELQLDVERSLGLLLLWRDKRQQKDAQALIERVAAMQIPHRALDAAGCLALVRSMGMKNCYTLWVLPDRPLPLWHGKASGETNRKPGNHKVLRQAVTDVSRLLQFMPDFRTNLRSYLCP